MITFNLSWTDCEEKAERIARCIMKEWRESKGPIRLYGVPKGGIPAAQLVSAELWRLNCHNRLLTSVPGANYIIDDIIDAGLTKEKYMKEYGDGNYFFTLVDKKKEDLVENWVSFPWERMVNESGPEENIKRLLQYIGENPGREGLKETPARVIKSYDKLFGGYEDSPNIKTFKDDSCDEMVIVKDIEFYSTCEHHMLPFFGRADIAYIPNGKIIGVSKIVRILEMFSRRLQIQERLCQQVTKALNNVLKPLGAACVLEAQHFCMTARGVEKQHSVMVTSSLTGAFKEKIETRNEFMGMIGK